MATSPLTLAPATLSATPAVAAFKFATCVVLVTTNGLVPVAILEINLRAVIVDVAFRFPVIILPEETVNVVVFLSNVNPATPFDIP